MATTMAATRQPFAPLNASRLQNLTSLKNRQNAITTLTSPSKRKAESFEETSDNENVDPIHFLSPKKLKSPDGSSIDTFQKPANFFLLTRAPPSPNDFSNLKPASTTAPRRPILQARSPAPRLNTSSKAPLTAPAGRSPTRKRTGILNRRKTSSPFTRVDPPKFGASSGSLGFSIDAALSGTIPSYGARKTREEQPLPIPVLHQPESRDGWFFDIHEDTPEELATNLMEHSTGTLDISSDEESVAGLRDERGKENVPPVDDISQTRTLISDEVDVAESSMAGAKRREARRRKEVDDGACDVDREPLGEMPAEHFYAEGCDGESVFVVGEGEVVDAEESETSVEPHSLPHFDFIASIKGKGREIDIDALMQKDDVDVAPKAALLEPIEKAEEGFALWESGSANGDS